MLLDGENIDTHTCTHRYIYMYLCMCVYGETLYYDSEVRESTSNLSNSDNQICIYG